MGRCQTCQSVAIIAVICLQKIETGEATSHITAIGHQPLSAIVNHFQRFMITTLHHIVNSITTSLIDHWLTCINISNSMSNQWCGTIPGTCMTEISRSMSARRTPRLGKTAWHPQLGVVSPRLGDYQANGIAIVIINGQRMLENGWPLSSW